MPVQVQLDNGFVLFLPLNGRESRGFLAKKIFRTLRLINLQLEHFVPLMLGERDCPQNFLSSKPVAQHEMMLEPCPML